MVSQPRRPQAEQPQSWELEKLYQFISGSLIFKIPDSKCKRAQIYAIN
jgi:hypothetical protein